MPTPLGIAVVGCGQIGRVHARRLVEDGRAGLVALIDPNPAATSALAAELSPAALCAADLEALEHAPGIDAVVLCTPTGQHFEQVRWIRQRGWPLLCEKPLADSRERIGQLIAESRSGPLLSLAYQRRHWATFRTLHRELRSGRWGPLRSFTLTAMERWQPGIRETWRDDPAANPGGYLGDAGSHKLDMLFYLTGLESAPFELAAWSDRRESRVEITTMATGRLGPVALSLSFVGDAQHIREDVHLHCEQADLLLRDKRLFIARDNQLHPLLDLEPESNPDAAFLDCLLAGTPNPAPADCALPVWDLTHAILTAARTQAIVRSTV